MNISSDSFRFATVPGTAHPLRRGFSRETVSPRSWLSVDPGLARDRSRRPLDDLPLVAQPGARPSARSAALDGAAIVSRRAALRIDDAEAAGSVPRRPARQWRRSAPARTADREPLIVRRGLGCAGGGGASFVPEGCPSGLRSATGNRVCAERCIEGSNPSPSALTKARARAGFRVQRLRYDARARRSGRVAEGGALLRR